MSQWNLSRIRAAIRKITGKFDITQIPDSSNSSIPISVTNPPGIDDYINDFYLYDFPEQLRSLNLKQYYQFNTIENVGVYSLPQNIMNVAPPVYVDGYQVAWYENPDIFYRIWPELKFVQVPATVSNGNATQTFTCTQTPILQGSVIVGSQSSSTPGVVSESFQDRDPDGTSQTLTQPGFVNPGILYSSLTGLAAGTVNYLTGAVSVTFNVPPAIGDNINVHYYPYVASRPRDILFYNQQFFLKPCPNDIYNIKMTCYIQPTVAIANSSSTKTQFDGTPSDLPLFNEWWQLLAYGAALKIQIEDSDHEEYAANKQYFEEQKLLAQRRCLKQLATQRIQTPYTENGSGTNAWPIFPIY